MYGIDYRWTSFAQRALAPVRKRAAKLCLILNLIVVLRG
jgi:hypothetical protein